MGCNMSSFTPAQERALREMNESPCVATLEACYEAFKDRLVDTYHKVVRHIESVREEVGKDARLGVVLDIDETVLFNDETGFSSNRYMGPFLDLFKREGILVYFVTGRLLQHRDTTIEQLRSLGMEQGEDFEEVFCKPVAVYGAYPEENVVPGEGMSSVTLYKRDMRYFIADNHNVLLLLSIGDQFSDVEGDKERDGETPRHPNLRFIQWIKLFSSYDIP